MPVTPQIDQITRSIAVPVATLHPPPAVILVPLVRDPMLAAMRANGMAARPDVATSVPVLVTGLPNPSLTHDRDDFVAWCWRCDANIDLGSSGRHAHGCDRPDGNAK
jgi:hypothetical protein